jgi:hypothetical protein
MENEEQANPESTSTSGQGDSMFEIMGKDKDKQPIKFKTEAHRKNYEGVMKARSERKLPIDYDKMMADLRKNSKD